jgi:hypothetical protein
VVSYGYRSAARQLLPSGTSLGIAWHDDSRSPERAGLDIVSLSGAMPEKTELALGVPHVRAFATDTSGNWAAASSGVVYHESGAHSPRALNCGRVWDVAAAAADRLAVAVAAGQVLVFDVSQKPFTLVTTIPFASSKLDLSADGSSLAARATDVYAQYSPDRSLKLFSLPSGRMVTTWADALPDFALSDDGRKFARSTSYGFSVSETNTGSILLDVRLTSPFSAARFSPDGTATAVIMPSSSGESTVMYQGTSISGAAAGSALAWLDNTRLLAKIDGTKYAIYDHQGTTLSTPALPGISEVRVISPTLVYSRSHNTVYDLAAGANAVWVGPRNHWYGTPVGSLIAYADEHRVLAVPR